MSLAERRACYERLEKAAMGWITKSNDLVGQARAELARHDAEEKVETHRE